MDPSNTSQLTALVDLVTSASRTAAKRLSESQTERGRSKEVVDPEIRTAIDVIEGACAQLCSLVARPSDVLANKFFAFFEPACLRVALAHKIPDILQETPSGVHISELGKRTGLDPGKLGRILRLLATKHVFQEVDKDTFANNYLSSELVSENPMSSFGLHITDECFKASALLDETLSDPKLGASNDPSHAAFVKYFVGTGNLFDYFAGSLPEQVERAQRFGIGMLGWGAAIEADAIIYDFPWSTLPPTSTICDLGGGVGNISIQLAHHYPHLHILLQDTSPQLHVAQTQVWPERCPQAIKEKRIEFKEVDFLKEGPRKGCDVYLVKNILHDWNDQDCLKILQGVHSAMTPKSRLLIYEFIVRPAHRLPASSAKFTQAPEPLLPNFGDGRIRQYSLDINMMAMLNSKERTLEDFIQLADAVGLRFVKLWEAGEMGLIELVTKE